MRTFPENVEQKRRHVAPATFTEVVTGEITPGTAGQDGPAVGGTVIELAAHPANTGSILYGPTGRTPAHFLPPGQSRAVPIDRLDRLRFQAGNATDRVSFAAYH